MASSPARLTVVLMKLIGGIVLGYSCVKLGFLVPSKGHLVSMNFIVGKIAFPCVIFNTIATADISAVTWSVIAACNIARLTVFFSILLVAHLQRGSMVAIAFAFFAISSNDFAIGFPVIEAMYPKDQYPENLPTHLAINALILCAVYIPIVLVMFEVTRARQTGGKMGGRTMCRIGKNIVLNPVMIMTFLALLYQLFVPKYHVDEEGDITLQPGLYDLVDLGNSLFGSLSLIQTGACLGKVQITKWPVVLTVVKVLVCAFLSAGFCYVLVPPEQREIFVNFAYLYGSIPTSTAPLVLAQEFAPEVSGEIATSIVLGLAVAGPLMFSSSLMFEGSALDLMKSLTDIQIAMSSVNIVCLLALGAIVLVARRLFFKPPMNLFVGYIAAMALYAALEFDIVFVSCAQNDIFTFFYSFAQNLCRGFCLLLFFWKVRGIAIAWTKRSMLGVTLLAVVAGLVVPPATFNEICGKIPDSSKLLVTNLDLGCKILVLLTFFVMLLVRRRGAQDAAPSRSVDEEAVDEMTTGLVPDDCRTVPSSYDDAPSSSLAQSSGSCQDSGEAPRQAAVSTGAVAEASYDAGDPLVERPVPETTITVIGIRLAMSLLLNIILALVAMQNEEIAQEPVFTQMLIIEYILEHSQPIFLLGAMLLCDDFAPALKLLSPRRERYWTTWDASRETRGSVAPLAPITEDER